MKVWITKYALTQGIFEIDSNKMARFEIDKNLLVFGETESSLVEIYKGEGREWHRTKESAVNKAEELRIGKIEHLKKQIRKLEELKFE